MNDPKPHLDPVCGMRVADDTPHRSEHDGRVVHFCSAGGKARFDAEPSPDLDLCSRESGR